MANYTFNGSLTMTANSATGYSQTQSASFTLNLTGINQIESGLLNVYKTGTAKLLRVNNIEICGKSGTVENFTKINGKKTQLTDHSIFVAYAPKVKPKIAISVLVENGHYGSRWAGMIASLMIEKYLKGEVSNIEMESSVK